MRERVAVRRATLAGQSRATTARPAILRRVGDVGALTARRLLTRFAARHLAIHLKHVRAFDVAELSFQARIGRPPDSLLPTLFDYAHWPWSPMALLAEQTRSCEWVPSVVSRLLLLGLRFDHRLGSRDEIAQHSFCALSACAMSRDSVFHPRSSIGTSSCIARACSRSNRRDSGVVEWIDTTMPRTSVTSSP